MEEKLTIKQLFAILAAGLFSFCGVLIETATNITFPTLMNEFHISTSLVQWMTTGNLLMMGIMIPISSYLKRRFQTKKFDYIYDFLIPSDNGLKTQHAVIRLKNSLIRCDFLRF